MNKNPKVSIIIPIYNVEKYLETCLNSVINQTLKDIEIICVNDCSPDNSLKILKDYSKKDSRIKIINFEENKGVALSRNTAIKEAQGEYIMFLDPDDWYEPEACEISYNQIKKNQNDFVIFNFNEFIEETGKFNLNMRWRISPFEEDIDNPHIKLYELNTNFIKNSYTWVQIYSRDFLINNDIFYNEDLKMTEDTVFFIKAIIHSNTISVIDKPLYNYRIRKTSASFDVRNNWKDIIKSRRICYEIIKKSPRKHNYIYPFLVFTIRTMSFWQDRINELAPEISKDFYNELKSLFIDFNNEYDISKISQYINYRRFKKIIKTSWAQYKFTLLLRKLFDIYNKDNHKVFNIFGLKIKIPKNSCS